VTAAVLITCNSALAMELMFPSAGGNSSGISKTEDKGKTFSLWPFYYRDETPKREMTQVLWPLYEHEKTVEGNEYRLVGPFYMNDKSKKADRNMHGVLWTGMWLAEWGHDGGLTKKTLRPLVSWERDVETGRSEFDLLFPLWERLSLINYKRTRNDTSFRFFPLAYYRSGKEYGHLVGFPLLWYWRDSVKKSSNRILFPLYWHKSNLRQGYSRHIFAPLLAASTRDDSEDYYRFDALFPFIGHRRRFSHSMTWMLPPLFFADCNAKRNFAFSFPLFWHYRKDKGTKNESSYSLFFPLFGWHKRGIEEGDRYRRWWALPPLFSWATDERNDRFNALLLPPFGLVYDSNRYRTKANYLLLGWHWRYGKKNKDYTSSGFLPLYAYNRDAGLKKTWWMATPLAWHMKSPKETYTWLGPIPPLYLHYKDKEANDETHWAGVLYYQNKKPDSTLRVLFPFYWQRHRKDLRENYVAFPVLLSGWYGEYDNSGKTQCARYFFTPFFHWAYDRRPERDLARFDAVYPLISYQTWKGGKHARFAPFFWYGRNEEEDKNYLGFIPFYLQYRKKSDSVHMITPLAWQIRDDEKKIRYRTLFPLLHDYTTSDSRFATFFPLIFYSREGKRKNFTVFPFYLRDWSDEHTADVTLLFYRHVDHKNQRTNWGVFPLVYDMNDKAADTRKFMAIPLFAYFRNKNDKTLVAGPGLYYQRTVGKSYQRHFVLGPIFHHTRDKKADYTRYDVLFPFFKWERDGDHIDARGFPLYWREENANKGGEVFFPFYWRRWNKKEEFKHFAVLPPFYLRTTGKKEDMSRHDIMWPLVSFGHKGANSHSRVFPVWWRWKEGNKSDTAIAFPLFWHFGRNLDDPERIEKTTAIFPFYARLKRGKSYTANMALLNLVSWSRNTERDSGSFNVLWPFFRYRYSPHHNLVSLFPLVHLSSSVSPAGVQKRRTVGILPLFWYMYKDNLNPLRPEKYRDLFILPPLFGERRNLLTSTADGGLVYPFLLGYHTDPRRTYVWSFPLFLYWKDRLINESNMIALPFLFGDVNFRATRYSWALPFYGRSVRGGISRHTIFPLLTSWRSNPEHKRASGTVLWPLGWWKKTPKESYYHFHPLFYYSQKEGKRHITALPPLFFHGSDKKAGTRYNIFFPFFWDVASRDSRHLHIAPLFGYYHRKSDDVSAAWVLGPLFWTAHEKKRNAREFHFLWPIAKYAWRGEEEKEFRFLPLAWYEKRKNPDHWSLYLFPYYGRKDNKVDMDVVFPFWWRWKWHGKQEDSMQVIFPLYWSARTGKDHRWYVFPFYGYGKYTKNGKLYNENMLFFPLLYRTRSAEAEYSSTWVLWPLFNTMTSPEKARSFFWPIIPVYYYSRDGRGESAKYTFNVLGILAHYKAHGEGSDLRVLWEVFRKRRSRDGKRSMYRVLGGLMGYEREESARRLRFLWLFSVRLSE
jgi:hypothetical protein